jgi:hypothetical protein
LTDVPFTGNNFGERDAVNHLTNLPIQPRNFTSLGKISTFNRVLIGAGLHLLPIRFFEQHG